MKLFNLFLVCVLFSFLYAKEEEKEDNMNGLSTASAVIFGAVASPFVKAYDKLSGKEAKEKQELQRRKKLSDTLYLEMINKLKNRDAKVDALEVYKKDGIIYIPRSGLNSASYSAFPWDEPPIKDYKTNNKKFEENKLLNSLKDSLFGIDEKKINEKMMVNFEYDKISTDYKKTFNKTMHSFRKLK